MRILIIISLLLVFLLGSCLKEKEFPVEPFIEFNSFTKVFNPPDTIPIELILSFRFTDGDGDIGLYDYDTLPPYDKNLFIDILRLESGQPTKVIYPDTNFTFNSRIPFLVENEGKKPIEGVIKFTFEYPVLRYFLFNDTVAFDVSISDRALNRSNVIRTPYLIID